jgi:hypothetical protein
MMPIRPIREKLASCALVVACLTFTALLGSESRDASAAPRAGSSAGAYASTAPSMLPPDEEPAPLAEGERPPHLPSFEGPLVPETTSEAPSRRDWLAAPNADDVRITDPSCKAQRIREWYRVACRDEHVSVIAGKKTDLEIDRSNPEGAAVIFPVRRGDTRLIAFAFFFKWGIVQDAILSVQWLDGDPRPLLTVIGVPR